MYDYNFIAVYYFLYIKILLKSIYGFNILLFLFFFYFTIRINFQNYWNGRWLSYFLENVKYPFSSFVFFFWSFFSSPHLLCQCDILQWARVRGLILWVRETRVRARDNDLWAKEEKNWSKTGFSCTCVQVYLIISLEFDIDKNIKSIDFNFTIKPTLKYWN